MIIGIFGGLIAFSNQWTTIVPEFGGTYTEGIVGSPRFINPVLANSDADRDLVSLVYSGLVRLDADGNVVPDLAQSWNILPDGKTYQFSLKPKLFFHDGKKLTSADIVYTIGRIQNPALKSPLRVPFEGVTVTAPDEQTVVFTLEKPYAEFLSELSVGIMPEHIWSNIPDEAWATDQHNTEPIGSGPFRITDVSRSRIGVPETFTLSAFSRFALGRPYLKNFIIECFANKQDAYDALDNNSIDGLAGVDSKEVTSLSGDAHVITTPLPRVFGLFMNSSKNKIFTDPAVVSAVNTAIDKTAMVDAIFAGYAHVLSGPLPAMTDPAPGDYQTKKTLAEKTLDNAGWKLNTTTGLREKSVIDPKTKAKTNTTLSFSISTANTPELEQSAQLIADQLAQVGIRVDVKVFEIGTLNSQVIRDRDFETLLFGQVIRHDTDLYAFWHSSQKSDPGLNITGYANARVDGLLESALREPDPRKRITIYDEIQIELAKNANVAFLYAPDFVYIINNNFNGVTIPPIATMSDRFSLAHQWYKETNKVWTIFNK